jgi:hypothetical protein
MGVRKDNTTNRLERRAAAVLVNDQVPVVRPRHEDRAVVTDNSCASRHSRTPRLPRDVAHSLRDRSGSQLPAGNAPFTHGGGRNCAAEDASLGGALGGEEGADARDEGEVVEGGVAGCGGGASAGCGSGLGRRGRGGVSGCADGDAGHVLVAVVVWLVAVEIVAGALRGWGG